MNQYYVPFSKLAVDTVFKNLDKEESENKYGETLVIYLEQNPADNKYGEDVIRRANAPKCLKAKMAEDTEKDKYIISKGKVKGKKSLKVMYLKSDNINYQHDFPQEADFENIEDDLTQAPKIDAALKIGQVSHPCESLTLLLVPCKPVLPVPWSGRRRLNRLPHLVTSVTL